jgi:hypothetical protein
VRRALTRAAADARVEIDRKNRCSAPSCATRRIRVTLRCNERRIDFDTEGDVDGDVDQ